MERSRKDMHLMIIIIIAICIFVVNSFSLASEQPSQQDQERAEKVIQNRMKRITQAEREAAASRAAAKGMPSLRTSLSTGTTQSSTALNMPMPAPGDIPHYFGPYPNWAFSPPIRKFIDTLPGLGPDNANNLKQYIPVGIPDTTTYPGSDYYEIELRQYKEKMHSDLPATTLRGYVQVKMVLM